MISKLAYVHPDAKIGNNVTVEPFAYIAGDVVIGDGCWIGPGAVIHDGARIGKGCRIHTAASVSCLPQDLKFAGEVTTAEIGDYNDIREYVTISRGTASRGKTVVGDHNLLMAYVHIAHDDVVGSNCVIANRVSLAGEVEIGDWVVIGGHAAIHQWTRIGDHAMIQGGPRLHPRAHRRDPRCLPHPLPERPELHVGVRGGREAGTPKQGTRRAGEIHPRIEARHHQAL